MTQKSKTCLHTTFLSSEKEYKSKVQEELEAMGSVVWSNKIKFCNVNMALITKGQGLLNPEFQ